MALGIFDTFLDRNIQIGMATAVVVGIAAVFIALRIKRRKSPEELERLRRQLVSQTGRVADGIVQELHENTFFTLTKFAGSSTTQPRKSVSSGTFFRPRSIGSLVQ